ncbi:MAG: CDP-diacylglycerol--glycerol-3-phosphate 3-phosphatidyltransferase [Nitrospirota bacterium]|nr:CDP-diacylglycerol--glycerol-3-phosphate 3-phosphatidyltransferase [Nitrospirota bacterium]
MLNWANILTLGRIFLIPAVILADHSPKAGPSHLAAFLFLIASLTDLLDGYIARRFNMVTSMGKLLDPVADKILVSAVLFLLVAHALLPAILAIIVVAREFAVSGLRSVAASQGIIIPAENLGKAKMVFQTVSITLLLDNNRHLTLPGTNFLLNFHWIGLLIFWIALILTLISGLQYLFWYLWVTGLDDAE